MGTKKKIAQKKVQSGTAVSVKGQKKVVSILEAAYSVLIDDGFTRFSLRNVSKCAGIHLKNLQYYFQTRDDLIHALADFIADKYSVRLNNHLKNISDDPLKRLEGTLNFYFKDIQKLESRRNSLNEWALLSSADEYIGHELQEYYSSRFSGRFLPLLHELCPDISTTEADLRSRLITALIEGLLIMIDLAPERKAHSNRLCLEAKRQAIRIALGA